ncbi:MAG: alpha/beta fold hydrolase [Pseudomonadota bacterium]
MRLIPILLLLSALILSACAGRPPALLVPISAQPSGAKNIDVLAISTRAPSDVEGEIYSGERGDGLSAHIVDISIPPTHRLGYLEAPSSKTPKPEKEFAVRHIEAAEPERAWQWFDEQNSGGRLLIFVHGYRVRFADAVFRLSQVAHDSGIKTAPVLFTWPSRGKLFSYFYDRESANFSRDALELILAEAVARDSVSEITLLAHSMGSWLTMEALRQTSIRNGTISPKIRDVVLASPDLDLDVFDQQIKAMGDERPHFTFLVSEDDRALGISKFLAGGQHRLGAINPLKEPYRSRIENTQGITVVDLSEVDTEGGTTHSKFAATEAMTMLGAQMKNGRPSILETPSRIGQHAGAVIVSLGNGVAQISE